MPNPLQTSAVDPTSTGGSTRTITLTGVTAGSTLVAWLPTYRYDPAASHITGVSSSNGGAFTLVRGRIVNSQNGSGTFRLGLACYLLTNVAAGSHTITASFANSSGNTVSWFVSELPGVVPTSPVDIATDVDYLYGSPSVSIGPTGNLSQAPEFAMVVFMGMGTDIWNGATSGDGNPPSGWTAWRAFYDNFSSVPPPGVPFAAYYQTAATTAPLAATVTAKTGSITDPWLVMLVTLKLAAGSYYVEVLLSPQAGITVDGSTGWTVEYSAGDPRDGATIATNVTAQATGNELRVPAPTGTTVGQLINVVAYNTALSHGAGTGVGTTRGVGTVKAA